MENRQHVRVEFNSQRKNPKEGEWLPGESVEEWEKSEFSSERYVIPGRLPPPPTPSPMNFEGRMGLLRTDNHKPT